MEERRTQLDYHKNAVLHRYVPLALVANAVRASGRAASLAEVKERTRWLSRLFKLEFMYRVGASFDELFDESAGFLARLGAVEREGEGLRAGRERETLDFLADLLRPYLEAYHFTAEALAASPEGTVDRRALLKAALDRGRASWAAGRVALRESVSKATVENAVEWLVEQGSEGGEDAERPALTAGWREQQLPETLRELARHLAS